MIKKLIEKLFGVKIEKVTVKEEIGAHDEVPTKIELSSILEDSKITEAEINAQVKGISSAIIALGYKAIPDILRANHHLAVEKWLMFKMMDLDHYQKETTNLEALNMDEMIALAEELNLLSYRKRMIEEGKANVSEKQMKLWNDTYQKVKKLDRAFNKSVPKDKFQASDDIEEMFGIINNKRVMIGNITEGQYKMLKFQCKTLGIEYVQPASIEEASEVISKNKKVIEEAGIDTTIYATEKQIQTIKRYYKLVGKRFIKTSQEKWAKASISEASDEIERLREVYLDCEASSDRIKYLKKLAENMQAPLADNLVLTNRKVNELNYKFKKQLLVKMASIGEVAMTKNDINELSPKAVNDLIREIKMERKTKNYADSEDGYNRVK